MAPRPFLVSGGSEDPPARWKALNHAVAVNKLLGHENRVAMTPDSALQLQKLGHECFIETGAGAKAGFSDAAYEAAGGRIYVTDWSNEYAQQPFPTYFELYTTGGGSSDLVTPDRDLAARHDGKDGRG